MQLREKIHDAINKMPAGALALLYEHIKVLENIKSDLQKKRNKKVRYTLEKVHEMTAASKSCWSDTVIEERQERA
jgi:hypothetical protein